MNIEFVGRHLVLDPRLREAAEEKIEKLSKFLGEPVDVHVTLENEKHRQIVEVRVKQRGGELMAREVAPEHLEALNLALDKVDGQARRARARQVDRRRRPARTTAPLLTTPRGGSYL